MDGWIAMNDCPACFCVTFAGLFINKAVCNWTHSVYFCSCCIIFPFLPVAVFQLCLGVEKHRRKKQGRLPCVHMCCCQFCGLIRVCVVLDLWIHNTTKEHFEIHKIDNLFLLFCCVIWLLQCHCATGFVCVQLWNLLLLVAHMKPTKSASAPGWTLHILRLFQFFGMDKNVSAGLRGHLLY